MSRVPVSWSRRLASVMGATIRAQKSAYVDIDILASIRCLVNRPVHRRPAAVRPSPPANAEPRNAVD
jgi:hypothetical protein